MRSVNAMLGYTRALVRKSIPFLVVESNHLDALDGLKVLFMPRTLVTDERLEAALARFVERGGTLVCESESGAFSPEGLYRYPEDRFTAKLTGLPEIGRRALPGDRIRAAVDGMELEMALTQWVTPWRHGDGEVCCEHPDGALIQRVSVGKGHVILCGAYLGEAYRADFTPGFEAFVEHLARKAGWVPDVEVISPAPDADHFVYVKHGQAAGGPVVFVFAPEGVDTVTLRFSEGCLDPADLHDLVTDTAVSPEPEHTCDVTIGPWRLAVLTTL